MAVKNRSQNREAFWFGARKDWKLRLSMRQSAFVAVTVADLRTHALILGSTGSGKTTGLLHLIAQAIGQRVTFIVLDYRGTFADAAFQLACLRIPAEKIALIDLREKLPLTGFNPLAGAGEAYFRALSLIDAVAEESESWGVQLAEYMRYAFLLLAETAQPITNLDRVFFDAEYRSGLIAKSSDEKMCEFWQRYDTLSNEKQQALASPVLNKVSLLFATDGLRKLFSHPNPIDLAKHLNTRGTALIISLAGDELSGAGRMVGNILLNAIRREIFARVPIPETKRNLVHFFVDEFENFDSTVFEHFLAEARKFGLSLILAHQALVQIQPKFRSLVLGGVGVKIFFRTGREDSVILSKSLTSDGKAIDFNNLPVGEAYVWKHGREHEHVLVNAPLLKPSLVRTLAACVVKDKMRQKARGVFPSDKVDSSPSSTAKDPKATRQKQTKPASLEEWL